MWFPDEGGWTLGLRCGRRLLQEVYWPRLIVFACCRMCSVLSSFNAPIYPTSPALSRFDRRGYELMR